MVYSNDEVQDKLNNANNSNADAKTVRDLSASKNSSKREESNKAKQQILLEEAIENNDTFKRLKQTLAKTTSGRMQVTAEDVAEIYTSMVSPSVNTVGENGAFFVDDKLISMAVGGMCYDISIEENGIVLNIDGTLNVEETKRQVAAISGNLSRTEGDHQRAGLVESKQQYMQKAEQEVKKTYNRIHSRESSSFKKLESLMGKSKEERQAAWGTEEGQKEMEDIANDTIFDDWLGLIEQARNMQTVKSVRTLDMAQRIADAVEKMKTAEGDDKVALRAELDDLLEQVGEEAKTNIYMRTLLGKDGKPSIKSAMNYDREYIELTDIGKGISLIQDASVVGSELWEIREKLGRGEKLTPGDNKFLAEFIENVVKISDSSNKILSNLKDISLETLALMQLEALYPDAVEDGKMNKQVVLELYNRTQKSPVSSIEEIKANYRGIGKEEARTEVKDYKDQIREGTFVEFQGTGMSIEEKKRVRRAERDKERAKEKAFSRAGFLGKINLSLEKMSYNQKVNNIGEALSDIYNDLNMSNKDRIILMSNAYFYNQQKLQEATLRGDLLEQADYSANLEMIESHMRDMKKLYKGVVSSKGEINTDAMNKIYWEAVNNGQLEALTQSTQLSKLEVTKFFVLERDGIGHKPPLGVRLLKSVKKMIQPRDENEEAQGLLGDGADPREQVVPSNKKESLVDRMAVDKELEEVLRGDVKEEVEIKPKTIEGDRILSQEEIDKLQAKARGLDEDTAFNEMLKADIDSEAMARLVKESQERLAARQAAVLKVDIGTMRRMAFEICEKDEYLKTSIGTMLNDMSVDDLKEFIDLYGNEQTNLIELQPDKAERSSSDGSER